MSSRFRYLKAYICDCDCGWTVEKEEPEVCWFCNSSGPHAVSATCAGDPKFMKTLPAIPEEVLFGDAVNNEEHYDE